LIVFFFVCVPCDTSCVVPLLLLLLLLPPPPLLLLQYLPDSIEP
jgi:hypothetical protein